MNITHKRVVWILSALALLLISCSLPPEKDPQTLALFLTLDKPVYHPDDQVIATVTLRNVGRRPLLIDKYMAVGLPFTASPIRGIAFLVTDPSGHSYVPGVALNVMPPTIADFVMLEPGRSVEDGYYLRAIGYHFTKPGKYTIMANYQNFIDPGRYAPEDRREA